MNDIHTIIFDLDGTLSDSALLTLTALERIAPELGLPVPENEAIRRATGHATPEFYYILFPGVDRDKILNAGELVEKEELSVLQSLGATLLFPGCRELLVCLRERGLRLCIASTGKREHVYPVLEGTGIMEFFDTISCAREDKAEMLREIIGNNDRKQCIMVGDMKKDYEAAGANGIVSVGALYGYCLREMSEFDLYIETPLDLLDLLEEIPCR